MASTQNTEDLAFLNSGRYLEWSTQETGTASVNGTPTDGVSGINVLDEQVVKVGVVPNSGATLDFRIWLEYEGLTGFKVVDGSERSGIDTGWTQQINVSGAQRIYVEVTSIDVGTFDIEIGRAVTLPNTVLRRRRIITSWDDLGTGILGESVVYQDGGGGEIRMTWNATTSRWRIDSTNGEFVTLEDWTGADFNTSLWEVPDTDLTYTFNAGQLDVDWQQSDPGGNIFLRFNTNIDLPLNGEIRVDVTHGTTENPGGGNAQIRAGQIFDVDNNSYTGVLNFDTSDEAQHIYNVGGSFGSTNLNTSFDTSATHTLINRTSSDLTNILDQRLMLAAFEENTGTYNSDEAANSSIASITEAQMTFYFRQTAGATFTSPYTATMFPIQIKV